MISFCQPLPLTSSEKSWRSNHLPQIQQYIMRHEDSVWGHLVYSWQEKRHERQPLTHFYAICVDTKDWGLYLDCRPRKIFAKCFAQLLVRPLHALIKTIYHLSMGPIFYEVAKTIQGHQDKTSCLKNSLRSLADIVRTPIYAIALMITTIAILTMTPFDPEGLYEHRKLLGIIEQHANWGKAHTPWTLARCFQPLEMSFLERYSQKFHPDTVYASQDPLECQLSNFTRSLVRQKRHFDLFDCRSLDKERTYASPILIFTK